MPFGLMYAPTTFQKGMMKIFANCLHKFMKAFLDYFTMYGAKEDHINHLQKCFIKCKLSKLEPEKMSFLCQFKEAPWPCGLQGRLVGKP